MLIGLVTGTALAASGTAAAVERVATPAPGPVGASPWWMIHPLTKGSRLTRGWTVGELSPVRKGAAVLTLIDPEGKPVDVHLCAHEGNPKGVAYTTFLDFVVMDGADGDRATNETLGRILTDLARRIRRNEVRGEADLRPVARMLPHGDRIVYYGPDNL